MHLRKEVPTANTPKMYGSLQDAVVRYSMGITTLRKHAEKANAVIKIGKKVLISYEAMDAYLNQMIGT